MKFERITFTVRAPKKRVHRALFDRDNNFRGRQHDDKHAYQRKPRNNRWEREYEY